MSDFHVIKQVNIIFSN